MTTTPSARSHTRRARLFVVGAFAVGVLGPASWAFATWLASGSNSATALSDSLVRQDAPTTVVNGLDVEVHWLQGHTEDGARANAYKVVRYPAGAPAGPGVDVCPEVDTTLLTCSDPAGIGAWQYTVSPRLNNWIGAESTLSAAATVSAPAFAIDASQVLAGAGGAVHGGRLSHYRNSESVTFHLDAVNGPLLGASGNTVGGTGELNDVTLTVPNGLSEGSHRVWAVGDVSQARSNVFRIDATNPSSAGSTLPQPNADGWNNSNVTISLDAVDVGGSGVATITHSVNGGDPVVHVGAHVSVPVTVDGTTSVTFHATDGVGNAESPDNTIVVKLDKSPPAPGTFTLPPSIRNGQMIGLTPSDVISGVATVVYRYCSTAAGATCVPDTDLAPVLIGPFDVTLAGQLDDGTYRIRATVTDHAGNIAVSNVQKVVVDNWPPTGSIAFPTPTAVVGGDAVAFGANVDDGVGSGVTKVQFETSPAGLNTWTLLGKASAAPWTLIKDMTAVVNGPYEVRAVITDGAGNTTTTPSVAYAVRNWHAASLGLNNKAGGTRGLMEAGDTIVIALDDDVRASTICGAWTSDTIAQTAVGTVSVVDGATSDALTFQAAGCNLGAVQLGAAGYVGAAGAVFQATFDWNPTGRALTVTLGSVAGSPTLETTGGRATYSPPTAPPMLSVAGVPIDPQVRRSAAGRQF